MQTVKTTENNEKNKTTEVSAEDRQRENWQNIHKNLDDKEFAGKFYEEKLAKAKRNLDEILFLTSGDLLPGEPNSQLGHAMLMEIFEMFMIRHENFKLSIFAEELQDHIFCRSVSYTEASIKWRRTIFASIGLDTYGEPLENEEQSDEILDSAIVSEKR